MHQRNAKSADGAGGRSRLKMWTTAELTELLPYLTEPEIAELDHLLSQATPRLSFREFIQRVNPKYRFYAHAEILIDYLQRVADGEIDRLMIFMPPRHSKSETASRLFTAYYVYTYPFRWVGLCSYGAELAEGLSRVAQGHYREAGGRMDPKAGAVNLWGTLDGGGMWAAGVGGAITGRGFHLGIVDDPIKNSEEAHSETIREKHKDWWDSTFYTRAEPGAAIVVIQTRWHEDDLSGFLLSRENGDEPEQWTILNLPAIAEDPDADRFPETCTVVPDYREMGAALCPERYNAEKLNKIRRRIRPYFWNALYQQRPAAPEGAILKNHWWRFWRPAGSELPPVPVRLADGSIFLAPVADRPAFLDQQLQSWDMAFKDAESSSYVVGQVWGRTGAMRYLLDQVRGQWEFTKTAAEVVKLVNRYPDATLRLIEDKANGPAVISALGKRVSGLVAVQVEGSKEARARAISGDIEAGNVYLPHPAIAPWIWEFMEECRAFPHGSHDDQVDALSQALRRFQKDDPSVGDDELLDLINYLA